MSIEILYLCAGFDFSEPFSIMDYNIKRKLTKLYIFFVSPNVHDISSIANIISDNLHRIIFELNEGRILLFSIHFSKNYILKIIFSKNFGNTEILLYIRYTLHYIVL